MPETIEFNVNHYVWVKLTDLGREIHREKYQILFMEITGGARFAYTPPEEDSGGWSRWQMHDLMATFGEHMHMGSPLPFETGIRLEVNQP